jgi:ribonuclease-3
MRIMATETTPERESNTLDACQETIGYRFGKPELLLHALTHTSVANTRSHSNERMEFLGDSVLGLATCEYLYRQFPDYQEGEMTKVKSVVVSRGTCARISRQLGLYDYLLVGRGMNAGGDVPSSLMADVFESLVGAIFLDGGFEPARDFVLRHIGPEIEEVARATHTGNYKSLLQQMVQREYGETPRYVVLDEQGPDHNKCFKISVEFDHFLHPAAWGRNKKEAETKAAMNALAYLSNEEIPYPAG